MRTLHPLKQKLNSKMIPLNFCASYVCQGHDLQSSTSHHVDVLVHLFTGKSQKKPRKFTHLA